MPITAGCRSAEISRLLHAVNRWFYLIWLIALGRTILNLPAGKIALEEKHGSSSGAGGPCRHGQMLAAHDLQSAQILLTPDTETRRRRLNARATITTLLGLGVIPVVNENDTVTTYEIRYGDNDRLACLRHDFG